MESWDSGEDKIRSVPLGHERVKPAKMGGRRGGREKKNNTASLDRFWWAPTKPLTERYYTLLTFHRV